MSTRRSSIMKNYYKINEISKLYGIGKDSLRYYERIGILNPKRDINGYRMYGFSDISRLNVINELKNLGFEIRRIKELLSERSVKSTMNMLDMEITEIDRKILELEVLKEKLKLRRINIEKEHSESSFGEIHEVYFPERRCIQLSDRIMRDEEVDFMIKRLQEKHNKNLYILGNSMIGATVDFEFIPGKQYLDEDFRNSIEFSMYDSVFCIVDDENYDFIIPEGKYISIKYKGNYNQTNYYIMKSVNHALERKLKITSKPLEIYHIDIHETEIIDEFITEIQIQICD